MRKIFVSLLAVMILASIAIAGLRPPVKAAAGDRCPVCGMFVAKYRDFQAQVQYRDGSYAVFDGPKDLFKYLQNLHKYAPGKQESAIAVIYATDYYGLQMIDARSAWFVAGSDVSSPMGKELIAFGKEADAAEFKKDHQGKRILRFKDVTPALIATMD